MEENKHMLFLMRGDLKDKYGYSDINIKKYHPADKDPYNMHTFIISAEKWFIVKIEDDKDKNKLTETLNESIEKYLKGEVDEI